MVYTTACTTVQVVIILLRLRTVVVFSDYSRYWLGPQWGTFGDREAGLHRLDANQ